MGYPEGISLLASPKLKACDDFVCGNHRVGAFFNCKLPHSNAIDNSLPSRGIGGRQHSPKEAIKSLAIMDESMAQLFEQLRCLKGTFEERKACRAACTLDTCPLVLSYWGYRPNIPVNAAFAAIFVILMTIVLVQGVWTRRFKKYTGMMFIGTVMEVMGYVARLYAYSYPFSDVGWSSSSTLQSAYYSIALFHYTTHNPHSCTGFLRRRHILLSFTNRNYIWRGKLQNSTQVDSSNIYQLRCCISGPARRGRSISSMVRPKRENA